MKKLLSVFLTLALAMTAAVIPAGAESSDEAASAFGCCYGDRVEQIKAVAQEYGAASAAPSARSSTANAKAAAISGAELSDVGTELDDLRGDIDEDGIITSYDALKVLRISVSLDEITEKLFPVADVDRNGEITSSDALWILRRSVGLTDEADSDEDPVDGLHSYDEYELERVVVLSRHNIRAPLSGAGSALDLLTPHKWFEWSSGTSELSLRGGVLETNMGQYFKKWLEGEGLFPKNYHPEGNEVRVYSNSKQRTIATARFFSAGLLPTSNIDVEYHMEFDKMDPVFTPQFTFMNDEYRDHIEAQIRDIFTDEINALSDNYELLEDTIDAKESSSWKDGTFTGFKTDDTVFSFEVNAEPGMKGSLKDACSVSDALVLQYYEESDPIKAGFGHDLGFDQWRELSAVKDLYGDVLFTAPDVAPNVAHPLLIEIENEMKADGRKFSFLCGHDSNVGSVLASLGADDYYLPYSIESKTPIGCKLVFCKWKNAGGEEYISVELVYQTAEQLRGVSLLDINNPPMAVALSFDGLERTEDGLYKAEDIYSRFDSSIEKYDILADRFGIDIAA